MVLNVVLVKSILIRNIGKELLDFDASTFRLRVKFFNKR